ncbi:MAG: shikimate kinase [Ginsengibacter sp.]
MKLKIFLIGFMGSGKTHWGKIWAVKNQLSFYDLDEQIEKTMGESVANIFEKKGEENFREMERYVLRKFDIKNNFIMACGGGTPCFFENLQWMNEQGITIYLQTSPQEILEKVMNETKERPLLKKINSSELLFFVEQKLKEREPFYKQAKYILNTKALTITSLSEILRNQNSAVQ